MMLGSIIGVLLKDAKAVADEIISNISNRGVRASGKTQKDIKYRVEETDFGFISQVSGPAHIQALEDGRRPTKRSGNGTLRERIRQWIDDKGITPFRNKNGTYPTKDSLAFIITREIHRRGTNLYRHGGHSGVLSDVINEERIDVLRKALSEAGLVDLEDKIREEILK